jgi:hypothetical protein
MVTNTGLFEWTIQSLSFIGESASDFAVWEDNCTNITLAPSESCSLSLVFSPISDGQKNAELLISTDDPNRKFSIDLFGESISPPLFNDVASTYWAANYIHTLFNNDITSGCGDGNYCPDSFVSRAQMAIFIIRALYGENFTYNSTPYFADVPDTHWAFKYVQKMFETGITTGCGGGNYCPNTVINRTQMAVFIIRAIFGNDFEYTTDPYFSDVSDTHWAFKYVQKMKDEGITSGCGGGNYCPTGFVNRAQMAVFITKGFLAFVERFDLIISRNGSGSGTVTSTPSGINCGTDCSEIYNGGTVVTLTATPDAGSTFAGWSGDSDCTDGTVTMNNSRFCIATFALNIQSYTLTVNKNGTGTGRVTSSPSGINCGTDCSESYSEGTTVTLTASPDAGSTFTGWIGACSGTGACQVSMTSNKTATATFTQSGGGSTINYTDIQLTWTGINYTGIIANERIGPNKAQNFYRVERHPACTQTIQFALAGNIVAQANENMLVSNRDFGTETDAMSVYQQFLNTTGYEVFREENVNGANYWYWFAISYESEFIPIFNPTDTTYYVQIVNESNFTGIYRIEAYCW